MIETWGDVFKALTLVYGTAFAVMWCAIVINNIGKKENK